MKYIDKPDGEIIIGLTDQGSLYEFYVQDNGPGIPPESFATIFKKYETTNIKSNLDSSTGIGLSVLKEVIEGEGGRIWVESVIGQGSKFLFTWKK